MAESLATTVASGSERKGDTESRTTSRRASAITTGRRYRSFGNLVPRDVASTRAKEVCDEGRARRGRAGQRRFSISAARSSGTGLENVRRQVRKPFEIYERITGDDGLPRKRGWIALGWRHCRPSVAFVEGASVPVLGVPHRNRARQQSDAPPVAIVDGEIRVRGTPEHIARRVRDHLVRLARRS